MGGIERGIRDNRAREQWAERRIQKEGRWVAPLPDDRHGRNHTYCRYSCRCEPCQKAHRDVVAAQRKRRMAARVTIKERLVAPLPTGWHGRSSTYDNHGCRCRPCTQAARHDREASGW